MSLYCDTALSKNLNHTQNVAQDLMGTELDTFQLKKCHYLLCASLLFDLKNTHMSPDYICDKNK